MICLKEKFRIIGASILVLGVFAVIISGVVIGLLGLADSAPKKGSDGSTITSQKVEGIVVNTNNHYKDEYTFTLDDGGTYVVKGNPPSVSIGEQISFNIKVRSTKGSGEYRYLTNFKSLGLNEKTTYKYTGSEYYVYLEYSKDSSLKEDNFGTYLGWFALIIFIIFILVVVSGSDGGGTSGTTFLPIIISS